MGQQCIGEIKRSVKGISCYLSEGTNLVVKKKGKAISQIPRMMYGNKATDDGNLILSGDEKDRLVTTLPEIKKYIRKFIGSQEFIRGEERWCIYIKDDQYNEAKQIEVLNVRFERTRKFRSESTEKATRNTSITPYKFFFSSYNETNSIIIPRHSSENREYIPIGFIDANTIIADSANAVYNAQMWIFGILTSKMHMAWVKTVGGRLKTDYRYSAQLCYNTFPFPEISEEKKKEIEEAAEEVLCVRAEHSEKTLAEMYDPDKMPADLRAAHHTLDLIVESCYRKEPFTSDEERLEHLFKLYEKMTTK